MNLIIIHTDNPKDDIVEVNKLIDPPLDKPLPLFFQINKTTFGITIRVRYLSAFSEQEQQEALEEFMEKLRDANFDAHLS